MPLYIKDDVTAGLVTQLAKKRGVSKQDAVRLAVQAELRRMAEAIPLRERIAAWRKEHPRCPLRQVRRQTRHSSMSCPASPDGLCRWRAKATPTSWPTTWGGIAISLWETVAGLCRVYMFSVPSAQAIVQSFVELNDLKLVSIGERELDLATRAYAEFGKERRPAALNMGDCFAYACAKANGAKLLFKGEDFAKTDITPVR